MVGNAKAAAPLDSLSQPQQAKPGKSGKARKSRKAPDSSKPSKRTKRENQIKEFFDGNPGGLEVNRQDWQFLLQVCFYDYCVFI
jgi:hypothetical protein